MGHTLIFIACNVIQGFASATGVSIIRDLNVRHWFPIVALQAGDRDRVDGQSDLHCEDRGRTFQMI